MHPHEAALGAAASLLLGFTLLGLGCSEEADVPGPAQGEDAALLLAFSNSDCGGAACDGDQLCVATRGALCMPLPAPGQSCGLGCVLTEHCCNCTAFACVSVPEPCSDVVDCACIESAHQRDFIVECRMECVDDASGEAQVTCINVDFDEDPFAVEP